MMRWCMMQVDGRRPIPGSSSSSLWTFFFRSPNEVEYTRHFSKTVFYLHSISVYNVILSEMCVVIFSRFHTLIYQLISFCIRGEIDFWADFSIFIKCCLSDKLMHLNPMTIHRSNWPNKVNRSLKYVYNMEPT